MSKKIIKLWIFERDPLDPSTWMISEQTEAGLLPRCFVSSQRLVSADPRLSELLDNPRIHEIEATEVIE